MQPQEFKRSIYGDIAGGDVTHHTTVQIAQQTVNHHYHPALQAPLAPQVHHAQSARLAAKEPLTLGQKKLLSLMKPLPKPQRLQALAFMQQNFGTAMVKELEPRQVARAYLHVLGMKDGATK